MIDKKFMCRVLIDAVAIVVCISIFTYTEQTQRQVTEPTVQPSTIYTPRVIELMKFSFFKGAVFGYTNYRRDLSFDDFQRIAREKTADFVSRAKSKEI